MAEAHPPRGRAPRAGHRPGRRRRRGGQRHPPQPRRPVRPQPPDRLVPLPRPHRRRQDRAGPVARRLPLRRRAGHGPHRHERVHGEALREPPHRCPSGLRRLRRGRPAHRGRAPPALRGGAARRDREGPPRRVQRAAPAARRRPPHRRPGPHGRLHQRRADHDLEPAGRPARTSSSPSSSTASTTSCASGRSPRTTSSASSTSSSRASSAAWPQRRIPLEVTAEARRAIAGEGYDPAFGARPLKRVIQREIGDTPGPRPARGHATARATPWSSTPTTRASSSCAETARPGPGRARPPPPAGRAVWSSDRPLSVGQIGSFCVEIRPHDRLHSATLER